MELSITVDPSRDHDLEDVARIIGISVTDFCSKAILDSAEKILLNINPAEQIRRSGFAYALASGPFEITGVARANPRVEAGNFDQPLSLTEANLRALWREGVEMVSVSFFVDTGRHEPDFSIRQLLRV